MKTFFSQLFFAVAMFSGVVSVLADTTLFDWNDPGNAVVFATEITTLSHGGRPVEVNYAIKDNTLYSRVSFGDVLYDDGATEPSSEAASRGLRGFNIFGGYERAAGNVQEDYNFFFSRPNALWSYYEHAVQNDAVYAAYFNAETGFSQFFASNYLLPDGRDYFIEGVAGNSSSFVGGIDMHTKHEGLTYFIDEEEENGISESSQIGWSLKGNEGTEGADFTATYSDGVLEVSANGNFLFSFNYSEGNSYLEYAVSLDGLGLDHYNGIHIASQRENYYTFLEIPKPDLAGTPEPATLLIFGFGLAGLGLHRRFTKKVNRAVVK